MEIVHDRDNDDIRLHRSVESVSLLPSQKQGPFGSRRRVDPPDTQRDRETEFDQTHHRQGTLYLSGPVLYLDQIYGLPNQDDPFS